MPTEAVSKSPVESLIDELILFLMGTDNPDQAYETLIGWRDRLEQVAQRELNSASRNHGGVLLQLARYLKARHGLPNWTALNDFTYRQEKSATDTEGIAELMTWEKEGVEFRYHDLGELLQGVWDDSENRRVHGILTTARKIASGAMTIDGQAYKGASGAVQYALQNLAAEQAGPVQLEPGQKSLLTGSDGSSTFTLTGTPASEVKRSQARSDELALGRKNPIGKDDADSGKTGRRKEHGCVGHHRSHHNGRGLARRC